MPLSFGRELERPPPPVLGLGLVGALGHLRVELAGPPGNVDFRRGGSLLRFPVRITVRAKGSRPDAVAALLVDGVQLLPDFVNCPREVLTGRVLEEPVGHFGSGSPLGLPASIPLVGGCQFARV